MHVSSKERRQQQKEIWAKKTRIEKHPDPNAARWFKQTPYYLTGGGSSES